MKTSTSFKFHEKQKSLHTDSFCMSEYFHDVSLKHTVQFLVLSTFRLELHELQLRFPHVFSKEKTIPTLIFHGDKDAFLIRPDATRPDCKVMTRKEASDNKLPSAYYESDDEYDFQRFAHITTSRQHIREYTFNSTRVQIHEVLPQWSNAKAIPGVHHPKYMLIFTTEGIHVVISTANITSQRSTDIVWSQFFPSITECTVNDKQFKIGSDFGTVLEDFIVKQIDQVQLREDDATVPDLIEFVRLHTNVNSIASHYDFSDAEVDLISVVPGRDCLPPLSSEEIHMLSRRSGRDMDLVSKIPCKACAIKTNRLRYQAIIENADRNTAVKRNERNCCLYGMKRVKHVLLRNEDLLSRPLTASDILIVQPTSIGAKINNYYIDSMLGHYMPESLWDEQYDHLRQESWRLVWPTMEFIQSTATRSDTGTTSTNKDDNNNEEEEEEEDYGDVTCGLFFHPRSFAAMELDIHTQLYTYEMNTAPRLRDLIQSRPPHVKTYARLMTITTTTTERDEDNNNNEYIKKWSDNNCYNDDDYCERRVKVGTTSLLSNSCHTIAEENRHSEMSSHSLQCGNHNMGFANSQLSSLLKSSVSYAVNNEAKQSSEEDDVGVELMLSTPPFTQVGEWVCQLTGGAAAAANDCVEEDMILDANVPNGATNCIDNRSDCTSSTEYDCGERDCECLSDSHTVETEIVSLLANIQSSSAFRGDKLKTEQPEQTSSSDVRDCTCPDLAWCMLTSACLSKGAQGEEVPYQLCSDCGNIQSGYVECRNFELGVMFHSRPERQYRALDKTCPVHSSVNPASHTTTITNATEASIVVLPIPYNIMGGEAYCTENGVFRHRPYFHENHEANRYTVNQKLPSGVVTETMSETSATTATATGYAGEGHKAIKRRFTYSDTDTCSMSEYKGGFLTRHLLLGAGESTVDHKVQFAPQSLSVRQEDRGSWQQSALRVRTVGNMRESISFRDNKENCATSRIDIHCAPQYSQESVSSSSSSAVGGEKINIADFLC